LPERAETKEDADEEEYEEEYEELEDEAGRRVKASVTIFLFPSM